MAVSWSWAFGQESSLTLETEMEWQFSSTASAVGQPSNLFTYTYPGSPARFSWAQDDVLFNSNVELPTAVFLPTGWITLAYYVDGSYSDGRYLIQVLAASTRHISIRMDDDSAESFELFVDNVFKEAFVMAANNWQYVALKYDMSGATWSGQVFVNGVAATAAYTDAGVAAPLGGYRLSGIGAGVRTMYIAQFIIYDSLLDAGEVPLYVTRIAPNADTAEIPPGGWSPSVGLTDFGVTNNDPFDSSTYTEQAAPNSGDNMVTEVNNLAVQLGVVAGSVIGVTNHTYSSGTALQAFASVRDSGGVYADGATITPDASPDTTYAFATGTVGFTGASVVECKYEIV